MDQIIAVEGGEAFPLASEGTHAAVCVDVVDLGMVDTEYMGEKKKKHKIYIAWQIGEKRGDGNQFELRSYYVLSLHEKANLRKDLESWRGRRFTLDELQGFDVGPLVGASALLNVLHNESKGKTYANVAGVMPLPNGMTAPEANYVRAKDRTDKATAPAQAEQPKQPRARVLDDSDIPA